MSVKTVIVEADGSGEFTYERRFAGVVRAIAITLDDLGTPDVTITDGVWLTDILAVTNVAADVIYQPLVEAVDVDGVALTGEYTSPAILGTLKIEVIGAAVNTAGSIRIVAD